MYQPFTCNAHSASTAKEGPPRAHHLQRERRTRFGDLIVAGPRGTFCSQKEVPDAKLDYPIITDDTVYFADIGIPSLKLDIEYDGSYWHNKLKDDLRDMIIKSIGWKIVRIKEKEFSEIMIYPGLLDYITNT